MSGDRARESLSALLDGEAEPTELAAACAAWRQQPQARADWHAYALIGDALRSDDLAVSPARDAAFLAGLRERLAQEPVVLAPQPAAAPEPAAVPQVANGATVVLRPRRLRWAAPMAIAAGFVAVGGVLVALQAPVPDVAPAGGIARAPTADPAAVLPVTLAPRTEETVINLGRGDRMIRDARLDRYLDAHQQFAGSTALPGPSGFVREASAGAPAR